MTDDFDVLDRCPAIRQQVIAAINVTLNHTGSVLYFPTDGTWAIQWDNGPVDPFTREQPISRYETIGEVLDAAVGVHG